MHEAHKVWLGILLYDDKPCDNTPQRWMLTDGNLIFIQTFISVNA